MMLQSLTKVWYFHHHHKFLSLSKTLKMCSTPLLPLQRSCSPVESPPPEICSLCCGLFGHTVLNCPNIESATSVPRQQAMLELTQHPRHQWMTSASCRLPLTCWASFLPLVYLRRAWGGGSGSQMDAKPSSYQLPPPSSISPTASSSHSSCVSKFVSVSSSKCSYLLPLSSLL